MKTFKEYLREEEKEHDLVKFLKRYCAPACKDMLAADLYFWRGAEKKGEMKMVAMDHVFPGSIITTRQDRGPRDSTRKIHDAANKWFVDKFGQPIRSNTVFTDPQRSSASSYGPVKAVIPIGKYQVYWSPEVSDFTNYVQPDSPYDDTVGGREHEFYKDYPKGADVGWIDQAELLDGFLDTADYQEGDPVQALKSKNEIMVLCSKYLLLDISDSWLTEVILAVHGK